MNRLIMVMALLLIPAGLFVSAYQAYRFYYVSESVRVLENRQRELIETNKRTITNLASQQSPRLIIRRAQESLGMDWPKQSQLWTIDVLPAEDSRGR